MRRLRDLLAQGITAEARLAAQVRAKVHFERIEKATEK